MNDRAKRFHAHDACHILDRLVDNIGRAMRSFGHRVCCAKRRDQCWRCAGCYGGNQNAPAPGWLTRRGERVSSRRLKMHSVLAFISVVGGLMFFGPCGLILGPVALTITMVLLEIWNRCAAAPSGAGRA